MEKSVHIYVLICGGNPYKSFDNEMDANREMIERNRKEHGCAPFWIKRLDHMITEDES